MNTQPKSGRQTWPGIGLPALMGMGVVLLAPIAVNAQSAGSVSSPFATVKREADRLLAMTQPGYYKRLLIPDWREKQQDHTQAITAAAGLCKQSGSQTESTAKPIQFSGTRLDEKQVQLTWGTSTEATTYSVVVERSLRSADGFEPVAALQLTGGTAEVVTHQTIDPNPYTGYTYYRVKRVEPSGAPAYSQTVAVEGERRSLTVKAFPNPGQSQNVRFQVAGPDATELVSVALYDVQGRVLYQHEQTVLDADHRFELPGATGLLPGNYYLTIRTGDQHTTTSFILQP